MTLNEVEWDNYTILDFETSGLSPSKDRILQVGLMKVRNGKPFLNMTPVGFLVNPNYPDPFEVPSFITELTGHTTEIISEMGMSPNEALKLMLVIIGDDRIWAHNGAKFDKQFLETECYRQFVRAPANVRWFDSAALFKAWKMGLLQDIGDYHTFFDFAKYILGKRARGLKYNLRFCTDTLGIDTNEIQWHDATGDVVATYRIIQELRKICEA